MPPDGARFELKNPLLNQLEYSVTRQSTAESPLELDRDTRLSASIRRRERYAFIASVCSGSVDPGQRRLESVRLTGGFLPWASVMNAPSSPSCATD